MHKRDQRFILYTYGTRRSTGFRDCFFGCSSLVYRLIVCWLSVVLQRLSADQQVASRDRLLAESSYAALINIFFVCLVAISPRPSIGIVSTIMAIVGLFNCWRLQKISKHTPLIISGAVYLFEAIFGIYIILHSNKYLNVGAFETIIFFLFAISLIRAWNLTGFYNKKKTS